MVTTKSQQKSAGQKPIPVGPYTLQHRAIKTQKAQAAVVRAMKRQKQHGNGVGNEDTENTDGSSEGNEETETIRFLCRQRRQKTQRLLLCESNDKRNRSGRPDHP